MKKIVLAFLLLSTVCTKAQTLDTLGFTERVPNYYYWDTNWWDHYFDWPSYYTTFNPNVPAPPHMGFAAMGSSNVQKTERARYIYIDTFLTVIGVAGVEYISNDTIPREPEYYRIYEIEKDTGMILLAETRWDTATPKFYMPVECYWGSVGSDMGWKTRYDKVYEAYFEEPVVVHDSFYVSQTSYNNYCRDESYNYEPFIIHRCVMAYDNGPGITAFDSGFVLETEIIHPIPQHHKLKKYLIDEYNAQTGDGLPLDTNWHYRNTPHFLCVFPIFDTSTHHVETTPYTCAIPTGLRIMEQENNSVTLAWNGGAYTQWEIWLSKDGTNNTIKKNSPSSFAIFNGLTNNTWYTARVRTRCVNNEVSEWSDSIRFCIGEPPVSVNNVDDLTTYLMPNPATDRVTVSSSFKIRNIDVFSLEGKLMLSREVNGITTNIDVSNLPNGTYILRIDTLHGTSYKKLIIE